MKTIEMPLNAIATTLRKRGIPAEDSRNLIQQEGSSRSFFLEIEKGGKKRIWDTEKPWLLTDSKRKTPISGIEALTHQLLGDVDEMILVGY